MKNIFRKVSLPIVLVLISAVGLASIAYAAIPDPQGVIHGCYRSSGLLANGQMRIIDNDSETCANNETEITWNQTGPQGPPGPGSKESKRLTIPQTPEVIEYPFLSLPGFGDINLTCAFSGNSGWIYHNNSGQTVYINEDLANPVANGETVKKDSFNGPYTYLLSYGDDTGSKVGTLTMKQSFVLPSFSHCTTSGVVES